MLTAAVVTACALLGLLALFQLALTLGAPLGRFAWGGGHERLPGRLRVGSALSIPLYGLFALVLLDRAGRTDVLPEAVGDVGIWVLVVYFGLGTVMNLASPSRRERLAMTPVAAVLCACCVIIARS